MYSCPGRANSSNLPVSAPPKRQPISRSVAIPTLDVTMYKRRGGVGKETKLQVNIGVHSNSSKAGRRSGANTVGPSGAMSASAGNCGRGPTWCQGTLCVVTHTPPMVPSRVGGSTATPSLVHPRTELFHLGRPLVVRLRNNRRRCP